MMRCIRYLIAILCCACAARGQSSLELGLSSGRVIKHKEGLTFTIPKHAYAITLGHHHRASGQEQWHHFWGMPQVSHLYEQYHYGNAAVLGTAHALMRGLDIDLLRHGRWSATAHLYTGIGYMTRTYDVRNNRSNNAIGSHLNNASHLGLSLRLSIAPRLYLGATAHLLHISNGLTSYPNSGINSWATGLSVSYQVTPQKEPTSSPIPIRRDSTYRRWQLDLQLHYGRSENGVPNGPKLSNYVYSAGVGYRYHDLLTMLAGVDYEYKERIYVFYLRDLSPIDEARRRAKRVSIWVAHEFMFRHIVFRPQVGIYTDAFWPVEDTYYVKLGLHYRLRLPLGTSASIGVVLKTHEAVADHLAMVVGCRL